MMLSNASSGGMPISHEVLQITPNLATQMLGNVRNESVIDERQVVTYAEDMRRGDWKLNGDPLIFDSDGALLSGRLRLHACVRAQASFTTLVVRNVDPAHFVSIDALRRRRVADIMSIRKEKDGRALAATLTILWKFSSGEFTSGRKLPSSQTLLSILDENPEIRYSVNVARGVIPRLPHSLAAALHFMFSRVDVAKADAFFAELADKAADGKTSVTLLKRQLDEGLRSGGARNSVQLAGVTIKAWEAFRHNRDMALVRYVPGAEQFPKISGLGRLTLNGVRHGPANDDGARSSSAPARNLRVRLEWITPERAHELLQRNDLNRAVAGAVVRNYARDMKEGAWALNGQTIKIADTGRLLDGQHRCAAAIRANTSFQALIVEGLDEQVFDTFDLGKKRSFATILRDQGESNTAALAATLRQIWMIENGLVGTANVSPTVSELIDQLERHPDARDSVRASNKIRSLGPAIIIALYHFFRKVDESDADEFLDRLSDGVNLGFESPILKLRNVLMEDRANRKRRLPESGRAALIIKAWNAYYEDRPMKLLRWTSDVEEFPGISGLNGGERYEKAS